MTSGEKESDHFPDAYSLGQAEDLLCRWLDENPDADPTEFGGEESVGAGA